MERTSRYKLIVQTESGPREYDLGPDPAVIGRSSENTVPIDHGSISRRHGEFRFSAQGAELRDLGSSNGIFVNGKKIDRHLLKPGDEIKFGQVLVKLIPLLSEEASGRGGGGTVAERELSLDGAPAATTPTGYELIIVEGDLAGDRHVLEKRRMTLGRAGSNDIQVKGLGVSGTHAEIVWKGDSPVIRDLESTNGLLLGGKRVQELPIRNGTSLTLGKVGIRFSGPVDEIEIGGEDDLSDVAGEEADETLQFRHLSSTEVPARRRMGIPALVVLVLAVGAAAFFYFQPTSPKTLTSYAGPVEPPEASLLKEGFSAEETDAVDMWPLASVGGGELSRGGSARKTGRFGFILDRTGEVGATEVTLALHRDSFPVDGRRRYSLTGMVRQGGGNVAATLMMRFVSGSGEIIHEAFGPWVTGDDFEEVEITPTIPEGCTIARVGLVARGGKGSAQFDDIVLKPSDLKPLLATHDCNRFTIEISPHGSWSLRSDMRWLLTRFEYILHHGKDRYSQNLYTRPSGDGLVRQDGMTRFTGTFKGPDGTGVPVAWTAEGTDTVSFSYQPWKKGGVTREGFSFFISKEDLKKEGLLVQAGDMVSPQSSSFSTEGCDALVIGAGARPIRMVFKPSMDVDLRVTDSTVKVEVTRVFGSGDPLQIKLYTSLIDLMAGADMALQKGKEALDKEQYGEAFRQLTRVVREFPVKKEDIEEAGKLIRQVRIQFEMRKVRLKKRAESAIFSRDRKALSMTLVDARALRETYRNTPVESEAEAIEISLRDALAKETEKELKAFASKVLLLARDCRERGDVNLAEKYYLEIIHKCKGTPHAEEAAREFADMKKVITDIEKSKEK